MRSIDKWTIGAALLCAAMWFGGAGSIAQTQPDKASPAGDKPAAGQQPADNEDIVISNMRVQDFPTRTYAYLTAETTMAQLGEVIPQLMSQMEQLIKEGKVAPDAAPVFVYKGVTQDFSKPFSLEVGFPTAAGAQPAGDAKVRELEAFHCATVIYSGPIMHVGRAYQQVYQELIGAGMQPTGENREMHLYWEGPESPNNIEIIMIGVK